MNFKKIKNIFNKKKGIFVSKLSPKDHELILNLVEQHFSHLTSEIKSKEKINLDYYSEGVYIVNIISDTGKLYTKRISYIK